MNKILIVDDEPDVQALICQMLDGGKTGILAAMEHLADRFRAYCYKTVQNLYLKRYDSGKQ